MRIKLDFEDVRFVTTRGHGYPGPTRWLQIVVGDKPFSVWMQYDEYAYHMQRAKEALDLELVKQMEVMLTKVLTDKCAAIPDGAQLV